MRLKFSLLVCVAVAVVATGCRAFQVEAGFKQPAELTATAEAKVARPSPTRKPQLGRLAFVQGGDIWVKDLPDGQAIRLTQDGHNDTPTWSPSGEWLAFRKATSAAGIYQLWMMQADGANARSIDIVPSGTGQHVAWSPVEDRLAYISRNGLYVTETDGTKPRELVAPSGRDGAGVLRLAWSPDGQWIAFEKRELEGEPQKLKEGQVPPRPTSHGLWRIKADGSGVEEVYLNPDPVQTQSYLAGYSPDGQSLLFWQGMLMSGSMMADGAPLMRVPVGGGTPVQITKMLTRLDFLAWAPDGQKLALVYGTYRSTWYRKAIAVATLSGGLEVLSEAGRADLFPAFSPDGRRIAFTGAPAVETDGGNDAKQASAQRRIWAMGADGAGKRRLTDDPAFRDERPLWSADGSFILFARSGGEQAQLWLMRADGSDQRQVVDEMTPRPDWFGYYGYIDWGQLYDWWRGSPGQAIPKDTGNDVPVPTGSSAGADRERQATASPAPRVALTASSQTTQTSGSADERTVLHKKVRGVPGELDSTVYQGSTNESWFDTATGEGRYEDRVEKPLLHTVAIYNSETILRLDILRKVFEKGPSPYRRDTDVALFGERWYRQKLELGEYELVGRGEVGGRPALKVRKDLGAVGGRSSQDYRGLWLDASTYLPLQSFVCETHSERGEPVRCRTSMIDAEWVSRSSLPADLFDQTVPEGFEPGTVVKG